MKMINKNTEKDKKILFTEYYHKILFTMFLGLLKCYSVKFIKCFKIYQHVITTCSGQPNPYLISVS